eukprot:scaffold3.g6637.t1
MVFFFGKDKYENEDLIKYSLPHDIWFHVDALSSAHVYLRLPEGKTIDDIPPDTLEDACQLGNKENDLAIVYTPASNLRKTASMEVGQVGFHNQKAVKKTTVARRINEIVNRLNKTQSEKYPDLAAEKEAWLREQRGKQKAETQARRCGAGPRALVPGRAGTGLLASAAAPCGRRGNPAGQPGGAIRPSALRSQARTKQEQAAKEEQRRQQELMSYKHEMAAKYKTADEYEDDFM